MHSPRRRLTLARVAPLALALMATPLLAPTCGAGTSGLKAFGKGSIIIPMDACYQGDASIAPATGCPTVGTTAKDAGNVIRAYGLVYRLISQNIPVYWIIDPAKGDPATGSLTAADLTVQFSGGAPVGKYDWTNNAVGAMPANNNTHAISYMGGPFVIDASDAAAAQALLPSLKTAFGTGANTVNVHFSKVAFQANVAKTMTGLWTGGGASNLVPPIALLDITGGDGKNSEVVVQGYLDKAGLGTTDFPGAAGTSTSHGKIYDRLQVADFLPNYAGSALSKSNADGTGYRVLWIPHWYGPGSANPAGGTITQAQLDQILGTIGGFSTAGHDIFAECAGLGTLEGVLNPGTPTFGAGNAATQFQTTAEVNINEKALSGAKFWPGNFATPFLQLGDFPFTPITGAIQQYRPPSPSVYRSGVVRFISDSASSDEDYFTMLPSPPGKGNVVYLAGHDFAGTQGGAFQIAGARLVLNTLFNLSTACVATGASCNTGLLGACSVGKMACDANGNPVCVQTVTPKAETCDGVDNDCNGAVDDLPPQPCYDGPAGTKDVGVCHAGLQSCVNGAWSACSGEVVPSTEICNGLDDDCNGKVDDAVPPPNGQSSCYTGPPGTANVGICKAGSWTCTSGTWGCIGEKLPDVERCENGADDNCDGQVNENCGCAPGTVQPCYGGPAGTAGIGACRTGSQTCNASGTWGTCVGQVLPAAEACDGGDHDCDGYADKTAKPDGTFADACAVCDAAKGDKQACYTGPAGTNGVGTCSGGKQACVGGYFDTSSCPGEVVPSVELCDGKDNDCNGKVDDNATCPSGQACVNGACTFPTCGIESPCREGYTCGADFKCAPAACGGSAPCAVGQVCSGGKCVDPCAGVTCGQGAVCSGGACVGGGCYATGCPSGQLCLAGTCQTDPCAGVSCAAGTFCRRGDCVQSCAFMQCAVGERCGADGFCVADACSGVTCGAGQTCANGACAADPCESVKCGERQTCVAGLCTDDPCAGVSCPTGQCLDGQCFSSRNPDGLGTVTPGSSGGGATTSSPKSGGCGSGDATPTAALLVAGALLLARRRRATAAVPVAVVRRAPRSTARSAFLAGALAAIAVGASACSGGSKTTPATPEPAVCTAACGAVKCVDLAFDAANCGACGAACPAGNVCIDSHCGPGSPVAPGITSVAPGAAAAGTTADLALVGARFQAGAKLRVSGAGDPVEVDTSFGDAGHLEAAVDLSAVDPGSVELRVVNPGRVVSNPFSLTVVVPTPVITGVTPSSAKAGDRLTIHVAATGLRAASTCVFVPAGGAAIGVPTRHPAGGGLDCDLDLTLAPPGAASVMVQNEGVVRSGPATFTVSSNTPVANSLSPSTGAPGDIVRVKVTGTGFDPASQVQLDGQPAATTFVAASQLYADLVLASFSPGGHLLRVVNGAAASNTVTFTVASAPPSADAITPTPAQPILGAQMHIAVTGSAFDAGCKVQVEPPGGTSWSDAASTTFVSPARLDSTLTPSSAAGTWSARVACGGNTTASFPFQVLSNVAVLAAVTPAGAPQGTVQALAFTGSTFLPGITLKVVGGGKNVTLTPPAGSVTATSLAATIDVTGWDVGTYAITATNPGAPASNGVGFAVTPGRPTVAAGGISPASLSQGVAGAKDVTITGTNFASGSSGSVVHASSAAVQGGLEFVLPVTGVTVKSVTSTLITLSVDPSGLVPATYTLWVVNPGASGPQASGTATLTVTP